MKETHFMQCEDNDVVTIKYNNRIFYNEFHPWEVYLERYERFDKIPQIGDYFKDDFHFIITDIVTDDESFKDTPLAGKYKFYKIYADNLEERNAQMKIIKESLLLYKEKYSIKTESNFSVFDGLITDVDDILPEHFYRKIFYIYVPI